MAIAFVQEWDGDPDDRTTTNCDAINGELAVGSDKPAGLIVHSGGSPDRRYTYELHDVVKG